MLVLLVVLGVCMAAAFLTGLAAGRRDPAWPSPLDLCPVCNSYSCTCYNRHEG